MKVVGQAFLIKMSKSNMQKWEHKKIYAYIEQMNALGAEGWEFCAIDNGWAYFKRPLVSAKVANKTPNKQAPFKVGDWVRHKGGVDEALYRVHSIGKDGLYVTFQNKVHPFLWSFDKIIRPEKSELKNYRLVQ